MELLNDVGDVAIESHCGDSVGWIVLDHRQQKILDDLRVVQSVDQMEKLLRLGFGVIVLEVSIEDTIGCLD